MIWVISILASMGLDNPDWQAGLKHFGCAAYLQKVWEAESAAGRATVETNLLNHIEQGKSSLAPIVEATEPRSGEGQVLAQVVHMPLSVGPDTVVAALLSGFMQNDDLDDELAGEGPREAAAVAQQAIARYRAQDCEILLEAAE